MPPATKRGKKKGTEDTKSQKSFASAHIEKLLPYRSCKVYPPALAEIVRSSAHVPNLLPYRSCRDARNCPAPINNQNMPPQVNNQVPVNQNNNNNMYAAHLFAQQQPYQQPQQQQPVPQMQPNRNIPVVSVQQPLQNNNQQVLVGMQDNDTTQIEEQGGSTTIDKNPSLVGGESQHAQPQQKVFGQRSTNEIKRKATEGQAEEKKGRQKLTWVELPLIDQKTMPYSIVEDLLHCKSNITLGQLASIPKYKNKLRKAITPRRKRLPKPKDEKEEVKTQSASYSNTPMICKGQVGG
ncbi:hypothetical protein Glove_203g18 [Diversispora epigaea]|uniref:Uncharacterized protein n=1 Tax=Diversispora epigaea TaxID=1348612 RepID=A0A397IM78_9GLOM|nr:hypothetical protein Glove_203g18 [Diversispora epigaea]